MFVANEESPAQIVICPKCGRKVRIDKDCDCETEFIVRSKPR